MVEFCLHRVKKAVSPNRGYIGHYGSYPDSIYIRISAGFFFATRHKDTKNYNIILFNPQITQITQKATESEMRDDGVLLRYKRDKLVGITILEASKKGQLGNPDEIRAKKISPRWNGIKRFHWAGWAGR